MLKEVTDINNFSLNGKWTLTFDGQKLPAEVPGSLYHDLMLNGRLEDPFWRDNEDKTLPLVEKGALYERSFTPPEELLKADVLLLRCEGLDTIADICINGSLIGSVDNMHRTWEFPLNCLRPGENTISVKFHSPIDYIRKRQNEVYADGSSDAMAGFPHIRKAHCMFGWDWGPRLPDLGIWRDISIMGIEGARLKSVLISQQHEKDRVTLQFSPELQIASGSASEYSVKYTVTAPDGSKLGGPESSEGTIVIDSPKLWWPNGFGKQPLYTVTAKLYKANRLLDTWQGRIGLRKFTISRQKDSFGEEFCYIVNDVKIFAMGADYIPEDNILPRMNPERTRLLLEDCVLANMNSVRVWGGGFYPPDYFFDICDELGLVVWQDFMFCCAVYELDLQFENNIRAELEDNIRRIRHHASLGLWCGNNEMEWQMEDHVWKYSPSQFSAYFRMYEHIFPEILRKADPNTFYWPASPSSGGGFDYPNDPDRGDVHYWDVWHGNKPFSEYRKFFFRFASEFGFQSLPDIKTVEAFTLPEDRNMFSYVMEKHQRNNAANGKILNYLSQTFLYPTSFDTLAYASQLLQAEAIKYGVEHWRRNRGRCMGAIYWQLNDCWPVISWASIDYYGRWKALNYYAKRFFAPVLLSACEEGVITQTTNVNAEDFMAVINKSVRLSVSNEQTEQFSGVVKWALRSPDASVIAEGSKSVNVPPLSALWLDEMDFKDAPLFDSYVSYDLSDLEGNHISGGTVMFCLPKHFHFADPGLSVQINGDSIVVKAKAYARSVEISSPDADIVLSDNYFDMNAGEYTVKIIRGNPVGLNVRSVYDIR